MYHVSARGVDERMINVHDDDDDDDDDDDYYYYYYYVFGYSFRTLAVILVSYF